MRSQLVCFTFLQKKSEKKENTGFIKFFEQEKRKENFTLCLDVWKMTGKNFSNILEWVFRNLKTWNSRCTQTLKRRIPNSYASFFRLSNRSEDKWSNNEVKKKVSKGKVHDLHCATKTMRFLPCIDDVHYVTEQRVVNFTHGVNVSVDGVRQVQ